MRRLMFAVLFVLTTTLLFADWPCGNNQNYTCHTECTPQGICRTICVCQNK